ncbi:hypothetical protein [Paenibacillus sp. IITD108]|uniref:hypothetical protein n=1 Tax=Paenibacillus sp. IITD108 TaxID=3116649 RepID=UPI002F3E70C6
MSGWIKLHRKILDNPIVCKDSDYLAVWTYLLLNATHKEYSAVFSGQKITLLPGQLITGRKSISEQFNISESKVQRILKTFENDQQIEQQTSNKNRIISILSWTEYQDVEQQNEQPVNNKRTTTEQQVNTNKNVKNVKNERMKEVKEYSRETLELTNHLIDLMQLNNPKVKIPSNLNSWHDAMDKIQRIDKYEYLQIRSVIDWCQNDSFWKANILSAPKLREKMGTLIIQMQRNGGNRSKPLSQFEKIMKIAEQEGVVNNEPRGNREANHDVFSGI